MGKENLPQTNAGVRDGDGTASNSDNAGSYPRCSIDKEAGLETCRVCQCAESDKKGDAALGFLDIVPPSQEVCEGSRDIMPENKVVMKDVESDSNIKKNAGFLQFVSPDGEVFICNADLEMGSFHHEDTLIELGCSCKNDLALVHYACALKWFVNHGSTVCEICGCLAKNIRIGDFKKVISSLKEYEALRERTASGEPNPSQVPTSTDVDPDAVAAIRRQRLSEIKLWFSPYNNSSNNSASVLQVEPEQPLNSISEDAAPAENPATKWAVEGTGILLATGLLTVTLAWHIAPHVGKVCLFSSYLLESKLSFN